MNFLTQVLNLFVFLCVCYFVLISADPGVCYPPLGCFNITRDFTSNLIYRPLNYLPQSPDRFTTLIFFYSRKTVSKNGTVLDKKWLSRDKISDKLANFDGNKETKFIIHGFMDNHYRSKWMTQMKNEFLRKGDYNVFIVDWSEWNGMPYSQASANARVLGAQIALLIRNLNRAHKLKYNLVHLIGHSLGAHLAGYAGKEMKKNSNKIGRITGLDPAEPYFQYLPVSVRLDRTDADFVDVLHTDTNSILLGGLGMSQPVGHIDFYPNGGKEQPGCPQDRFLSFLKGLPINKLGNVIACNHLRAVQYFTESINSEMDGCQFTAYACESWSAFNTKSRCNTCGKTGAFCAPMGFNSVQWKSFKSDKKSKLFYLKTNSSQPFCVIQMKVDIPINTSEDSAQYLANIKLKMISDSNISYETLEDLNISSNNSYSLVIPVRNKKFFTSLDSIVLEWFEEVFDAFNPNTWRLNAFSRRNDQDNKITKKELYIKHIYIRPLFPGSKTKKFCSKSPGAGIRPLKLIKFNKNC